MANNKKSTGSAVLDTPVAKPKCTESLTTIIIKYDVGFGNTVSIRGQGANLSWTKGIQLKNRAPNEWVFEICATFAIAEFKVLVNDKHYESGPNHSIKCGATLTYTPKF